MVSTSSYTSAAPPSSKSIPKRIENAIDNPSYEKVVKDFNQPTSTLPPPAQHGYENVGKNTPSSFDRVSSPDFPPPPPDLQEVDTESSILVVPQVPPPTKPTYENMEGKPKPEKKVIPSRTTYVEKDKKRKDDDRRKRDDDRNNRKRSPKKVRMRNF